MEQWPIVTQVLVYVVAFNMMLTGLKQGLDLIKDKTASNIDNKFADILGKIVSVMSKILDTIGYNPAHKK